MMNYGDLAVKLRCYDDFVGIGCCFHVGTVVSRTERAKLTKEHMVSVVWLAITQVILPINVPAVG